MAPRGRATQPSQDTRLTNDCKTRMYIKAWSQSPLEQSDTKIDSSPLVSNSLIKIGLTFQAYVRPSVYSLIGHLLASFFILRGKHIRSKYDIHIMESPQGFCETGEMTFIPREQRSNFEWNRVQRQYWGTWNTRKQFSILGEQGHKPIYFRRTRERLSP